MGASRNIKTGFVSNPKVPGDWLKAFVSDKNLDIDWFSEAILDEVDVSRRMGAALKAHYGFILPRAFGTIIDKVFKRYINSGVKYFTDEMAAEIAYRCVHWIYALPTERKILPEEIDKALGKRTKQTDAFLNAFQEHTIFS